MVNHLRKAAYPILLGVFLLAVAACGGDSPSSPTPVPVSSPAPASSADSGASPAGGDTASEIKSFTLEGLTIAVGTTVTWTNQDSAPHTVTSGVPPDFSGDFDSSTLSKNNTFSHRFDSAGEFSYWCRIHPSMTAVITVR